MKYFYTGTHTQLLNFVQLFATSWTAAFRLFCPWDFPGKNTGVGFHVLFYGIYPGIGPSSPVLAGGFFTIEPPGKPFIHYPLIVPDNN